MRKVLISEIVQRGCTYCHDMIPKEVKGRKYCETTCPYNKCPYHQLDDVKKYGEYMKIATEGDLVKLLDDLG